MTEQLISFETAKLAKEKGFDDIKRPYYTRSGNLVRDSFTGPFCAAPTQSLLQRWLREEHNIIADLKVGYRIYPDKFYFYYWRILKNTEECEIDYTSEQQYSNYEEALEKGLLEALKLI